MKKRKRRTHTTEWFVTRALQSHPNFDYSNVVYTGQMNNVVIICPIHGEFIVKPHSFFQTAGCQKCASVIKNEKHSMKFEQWVEKCNVVHDNKYDYSLVEYINTNRVVDIVCSKHGVFSQHANSHLQGNGCPKCGAELLTQSKYSNTERFVLEAIKIHGNRYNYSKVNYVHSGTKVDIICSEHGIFKQRPASHLAGFNCPHCNDRKGGGFSRTSWREMCDGRESFVYLLLITTPFEECLKVGITVNLKQRFKHFQKQGVEVEQIGLMRFDNPDDTFNIEKHLLKSLREYKYRPKHHFSGHSECLLNVSQVLSTFNLLSPKV